MIAEGGPRVALACGLFSASPRCIRVPKTQHDFARLQKPQTNQWLIALGTSLEGMCSIQLSYGCVGEAFAKPRLPVSFQKPDWIRAVPEKCCAVFG